MNASSGNVVDSKIVELQFQNQNFESNAKTSLSTIERLKKALNFSVKDIGAFDTISKGVSTATEHTRGLTNAFGNLNSALGNIKNVAVFSMIADEAIKAKNAVESFVKSVSLDPISQGWQKYADKTEAVQTIMAATKEDFSSTAEQMKVVNEQLEKLNWFTDETSYNFVDMVGNIGKFTANKIPLEDAVTAMEGISTWAAISGQNAQSASRAMYNLAQAIGVGAVKLIDWRSVENANMGTAEFKQTVIETAESMKLLTKTSEDTWKTSAGHEVSVRNFTDALKDEWFTSEVLVKTLEKYGGFTDKLHGYMQEMDEDITTSELLRYIDEFKAGTIDMEKAVDDTGLTVERLKEIFNDLGSAEMEFGRKAFVAAQQAVTFEQAIDAVKDAASTAWMNTFEILFGDFEQAKVLWTDLSENLWNVFVGGISETNDLLEEAFNKSEKFTAGDWDALKSTGIMNPAFMSSIRKIAEDHGLVMDQMESDEEAVTRALEKGLLTVQDVKTAYDNFMTGGAGEVDKELLSQVEALKESDESFKTLIENVGKYKDQDLSKIAFGDGKYSEDAKELEAAIDNVIKALGLTQDDAEKVVGVLQELGVVEGSLATGYAEMTEEELKTLGWSDEQIAKFIEMRDAGEDIAKALEEIGVNPMSGGDHWLSGLYNIMDSMLSLIDVFQKAWGEVFPEAEADTVYQALKSFDETTENINNFIQTSGTLKETFKAIASVVALVVGNLRMIAEGVALKGIMTFATSIAGAVSSFFSLAGALAKGAVIFELVRGLIDGLGLSLGGIGGFIAKAVSGISEFLRVTDLLNRALNLVHSVGALVGGTIKGWIDSFMEIPVVSKNVERFKTAFTSMSNQFIPYVAKGMEKIDAFKEKVNEMGGLKLSNLSEVFKLFKSDVLDYFASFPGFKQLAGTFKALWKDIGDGLKLSGINVDGFTKKFDTVKKVFGTLGDSIKNRFSESFEKVQNGFGKFTDTGKKKITEFVNKVKSMGGIKLDNIIEIFGSLKKDVLDYFANWEGFTAFKDSIKGVWKDLTTEAAKFGVDLSGLTTVFNTVGNIGTKVFNKVKSVGSKAFKVFSSFGLSTAKSFGSLYDKISTKVTPFMTAAGERISGFVESLGSMDSISLDSISGLFKGLWDDITTYFKDVDIVQMLKDSFSGFWDQMRQNLKDMGLDLDWLVDIFETIGNVGLGAFGLIGDGVGIAVTKIQELWGKFTQLPIVQSAITRFQAAFDKIGETWEGFVTGAGTKFNEFLAHVQELGGVSFDNLGAIFDLFKEDVLSYFSEWDGFTALKDAFSGLWEDIKAGLKDYGIDIDAIEAKITGFVDTVEAKIEEFKLSKPFEKFLAIFTGGNQVDEHGVKMPKKSVADRILDFFESVKESLKEFEIPSLDDFFSLFSETAEAAEVNEGQAADVEEKTNIFSRIVNAIVNFVNGDGGKIASAALKIGLLALAFKKISGFVKNISAIITSITGYFDAMAANEKATAHLKNAAAVVLLAGAIAIIVNSIKDISNNANQDNLGAALAVVSAVGVIVAALMGVASLVPGGGLTLGGLAATIFAFAEMLKTLSDLDWDNLSTGFSNFASALDGIDIELVDVTKFNEIAGMLDTLSSAGLKDSIGTAILELAGVDECGSSLTLLANDMDDLGLGLAKFVGSIKGMNLEELDDSTLLQNGPLDKVDKVTDIINSASWGALISAVGTGITYPLTAKTSLEVYCEGIDLFAESLKTWCEKIDALPEEIPIPKGVDELTMLIGDVNWSGVKQAMGDGIVKLVHGGEEDGPKTGTEEWTRNMVLFKKDLQYWASEIDALPESIDMPTGVDVLIDNINAVSNSGVTQAMNSWWVGLFTDLEGDDVNSITYFDENVTKFRGAIQNWTDNVNSLGDVTMPNGVDELIKNLEEASSSSRKIAGDEFTVKKWFGKDALPTLTLFNLYADMLANALINWQGKMEGINEITVPEGISELIGNIDKASEVGTAGSLRDAVVRWFESWFGGDGEKAGEGGEDDPVTSMTKFADSVGTMADALSGWEEKMNGLGKITLDKEGIDNLIAVLQSVEGDGGLAGLVDTFIHGEVNWDEFGTKAESLGTAIKKFNEGLGEDADVDRLATASEMLVKMAELISYFKVLGDFQAFATFSERLPKLAETFNDMVGKIEDMSGLNTLGMAAAGISAALNTMTDEKLEGDLADEALVQRFVDNLKKLKEAIEDLNGLNTGGVDKLNEAVDKLGSTDVSGANNKLSESVLKAEEQMSGIGTSSNENLAAGMSDTSAVEGASANVADAALSALQDTSQFSEQGTAMITAFTTALSDAVSSSGVADIVQCMMMEAISALENGVSIASDYGGYFASGFASGIYLKAHLAREQAAAMATAAANAIKNALSIASPSKVTYEYGTFFGEGFGNAIEDYSETAYKKASLMSSTALKALGDSLNVIDDTLASEDFYEPVIRPVVDTSEIQNGATMIGSILSAGAPIRLFGDVKEINSTLDARRKAASLEDVVSALGLVERSASNIRGGDTYNVNGVTYDDGSNVSDAVRVLIHAATVERRR